MYFFQLNDLGNVCKISNILPGLTMLRPKTNNYLCAYSLWRLKNKVIVFEQEVGHKNKCYILCIFFGFTYIILSYESVASDLDAFCKWFMSL